MTKRKRISKIVNGILLGICILSAAAALLLGGETVKEGWEYDNLAKDAETQTADGIDWSMLRGRNQDIAAWLRVEGTAIDLPVVNTRKGDPADFYLSHDFDRNPSFAGCPYLDARGTAEGAHALVYGHHMGFTGQIFSPIFATYRQAEFDKIGEMYEGHVPEPEARQVHDGQRLRHVPRPSRLQARRPGQASRHRRSAVPVEPALS